MKDWLSPFVSPSIAHGTAADIATHLQRLLDAPEGSSLIIEVSGGEEDAFVQFTARPESIQFDHSSISTTLNIYTHVVDASHRKAIEALERELFPSVRELPEGPKPADSASPDIRVA